MSRDVRIVVDGLTCLECPRWCDGRLWFSDFHTHGVYSMRPDGRLLVVSMRDRKLMRREADGSLVVHADRIGHVGGHRIDMVVDGQGRAWVGESAST